MLQVVAMPATPILAAQPRGRGDAPRRPHVMILLPGGSDVSPSIGPITVPVGPMSCQPQSPTGASCTVRAQTRVARAFGTTTAGRNGRTGAGRRDGADLGTPCRNNRKSGCLKHASSGTFSIVKEHVLITLLIEGPQHSGTTMNQIQATRLACKIKSKHNNSEHTS